MSTFAPALLKWYQQHARELPWRGAGDAYAIWVSEVMLQQTRVETVIPYYQRWMARFPNVHSLASAPLQEVLKLWEGLGYYSRARNLHRAARIVVEQHKGRLPRRAAELQKLPGIGRYTAAAIASIAFGEDAPALDGNIRRVLARLFDLQVPARSPEGERRLWELAAQHAPSGHVGTYNQALMDLGATICTPRRPACDACPLATFCQARSLGVQAERPLKTPRSAIPHYTVAAAVIRRNGTVLLGQRPPDGLLGGLWEFPGGKQEADETLIECLQREIAEELGMRVRVEEHIGSYKHAYSHFQVTLHAYTCRLTGEAEPRAREHSDLRWVQLTELERYPMGKLDRLIAATLLT